MIVLLIGHFLTCAKLHGRGQIPRLGSKFCSMQKIGPYLSLFASGSDTQTCPTTQAVLLGKPTEKTTPNLIQFSFLFD